MQEEGRADQYAGAPRRITATDRFESPITGNVGAIIVFGANTHGIAAAAMASLLHEPAPDLAKTPSAPTAPVRASDELEALHAALDSRLAALEAALADPNECALEPLILDLARTATQEAEANARKLSAQARAEADQQAGSALSQLQVAEAALASEREAGLELHRSLGAARSELEAAKQKVATHDERPRFQRAHAVRAE